MTTALSDRLTHHSATVDFLWRSRQLMPKVLSVFCKAGGDGAGHPGAVAVQQRGDPGLIAAARRAIDKPGWVAEHRYMIMSTPYQRSPRLAGPILERM
jgi:hypothetical protein